MTVKIVNETVSLLSNTLVSCLTECQPFNIDIWINIVGGVKCMPSSNVTLHHISVDMALTLQIGTIM